MNIIFMGTSDFALPILYKLIGSNHQITCIFTQPPKPKGRGLRGTLSPVHNFALQYKIPVYTPSTLRTIEMQELINNFKADIIVVTAYGFIVPESILNLKKYGGINIHPSDLPRHRGAAPLQHTIIQGDKTSAVCIIQMNKELDSGDIILKQSFFLDKKITFKKLHDKCSMIGADLLLKTLDQIDYIQKTPQSNNNISYANKLTKKDGKINWQEDACQIDCKIRGMTPWPGIYFKYQNKMIKILESDYSNTNSNDAPGTVLDSSLSVACGKGILKIKKLQIEGKRAMNIKDFINGFKIPVGSILNEN